MGFLSSSATFVRYAVQGELPDNFWDFAAERIRAFAFRDIDDTFDERSVGWVAVDDMFDRDFAYSSYAVADHLILSLRVDERKVPAAILRKLCQKEERRIMREKEVPRLSRGQKAEIKENVHLALLKKAVPTPAVYDLAWNLGEGTLLFFSTNKKAQEILEEFFRETFGLTLVLQIPYQVAEHLVDPDTRGALEAARVDIFI